MSDYNDRDEWEELEMIDLHQEYKQAEQEGREIAGKKQKRRKKEKEKKKGNAAVVVLSLLLMISLGLGGFLFWNGRRELEAERAARTEDAELYRQKEAEAQAQIAELREQNAAMFTQETVDSLVEEQVREEVDGALEEAAEEREAELKERMMEAALEEGGGPMTAVRSVFDDYVFYTVAKDTYEFAPVLEGVARNDVKDEELIMDEDGTIRYVVDGEEKGIPMIDVSEYQGVIDWNRVAASGIQYAMLRAAFRGYGSGKLVLDEQYDANIRGATAAGIKIGAYVFSEAINEEEAREEARLAMDHLAGYQVDLPIVLDMEHIGYDDARADQLSKEERTKVALAFLDEVEKSGYKPMLYTGLLVYFHYLDQEQMNAYPLWFAFYSDHFYFPYKVSCWQYRANASVPGIGGDVDMSVWFVDPESL